MIKKELLGRFIKLSEIKENDFEQIIKWRNNPDYNRFINQNFILTIDLQKKWFNSYSKDDTQITYGIHIIKDNTLIGTIGATDIDFKKKEFIPGRLLIDEDFRLGPYLIDTFVTLYDYFFEELFFVKGNFWEQNNMRRITFFFSS